MKKVIALVLICLLTLTGCDRRSMNYIIQHEPSIRGIVTETTDTAILMENTDGEYWVSLDVENGDSMTDFTVGDEVVVYFDGNIAETYPMQLNRVYAIILRTPADRTANDRS
jgi:hypothetical protein